MNRRMLVLVIGLLAVLSVSRAPLTAAQSGSGYDLTWNVMAGGGTTFSTGGAYSLGGTIGQADVGTLSGGGYTLVGGFWGGAGGTSSALYLPLIRR